MNIKSHRTSLLSSALLTSLFAPTAAAQCPDWTPGFHSPGTNDAVWDLLTRVESGSPVLYAGGRFTAAGPTPAAGVARWDGSAWSGFGDGPSGNVFAVEVYDDGSGETVYAGGDFFVGGTPYALARFDLNTSSWEYFDLTGDVFDLRVHDDGFGEALYIGGDLGWLDNFSINVRGILRYDGTFSTMAGGVGFAAGDGVVHTLIEHVIDNRPQLFVGGRFLLAGSLTAGGVASWNGEQWLAYGANINPTIPGQFGVNSMAVFDDGLGGGEKLYIGGSFDFVNGQPADDWACWSETGGWEALPAGPLGVVAMTVHDDGNGQALYITGASGLGSPTADVARWDGQVLTPLDDGTNLSVEVLVSYDSGSGPQLIAGSDSQGINAQFHGVSPGQLVEWDGTRWRGFGPEALGVGTYVFDAVQSLTVFDDGNGPALYAGGKFATAGGEPAELVARFDGTSWSSVGQGSLDSWGIRALAVFDDGNGEALYATGRDAAVNGFQTAMARWDGTQWTDVGELGNIGELEALVVYDDGGGDDLYLGGQFFAIGGVQYNNVARWDGTSWSGLGQGVQGGLNDVETMAVYDDGTGAKLYVGGRLEQAGSQPASGVACWDGSSWSNLDGGVSSSNPGALQVDSLVVHDDGSGPKLYVAGRFEMAGGLNTPGIAAWDGTSWSALGSALDGPDLFYVSAMASFDPANEGPGLYVSGTFDTAGGQPAPGFAVWKDGVWTPVGAGIDGEVLAMQVFDDGNGRALFGGGNIRFVNGVPTSHVMRFADPCGPDLGVPYCTATPNSSGRAARVRADGTASVAAEDVTLFASNLPASQPTLFYFGTEAASAPFGNGVRCAGGNLLRILPATTSSGAGDASQALDFGQPYGAELLAGTTRYFQAWFRDPVAGGAAFDLSDGLAITLAP